MNPLAHPLILALGWTLLHFLWQGLLVALGTALLLRILRATPTQTRHLAACLGLLACLACPAVTLVRLWPGPSGALIQTLPAEPAPQPLSERPLAAPESPGHSLASALRPALPWVVGVWLTGCIALLLRLGSGWVWLRRLRHRYSSPATPEWQRRLDALARRMGLTRLPQLRFCTAVEGPLAHGWWKPAILLPGSLLTGMAPDLLEALLAHELAHIQRQDYLANLLQCLAETLLFYHPAVWWISAKIRSTREEACDDLAAKAIGEPRRLALALAELDLFQLPAPALGAHQGDLMNRIKRLLNPAPPRPLPVGLLGALLAAAFLSPLMGSPAPKAPKEPIRVSAQLLARIDTLAAKEGIDPQLLRAMAWAESRFDPDARSPRGALGILQVMPETAKKYGAVDLANREQVATAGARYLKSLLTRYPGDLAKAVAAYNCGEEAMDAGRITEEASRYRSQVLDLLKDKLIQPLPLLAPGEVRGDLQPTPDGPSLDLTGDHRLDRGSRASIQIQVKPDGQTLGIQAQETAIRTQTEPLSPLPSSEPLPTLVDPASQAPTPGAPVPKRILAQPQPWELIKTVPIRYPKYAWDHSIQGTVIVEVKIDEQGLPLNLRALEGPESLAKECLAALKHWQFASPAHYGFKGPVTFQMGFQFERTSDPTFPADQLLRQRYASIDFIISANAMRGTK